MAEPKSPVADYAPGNCILIAQPAEPQPPQPQPPQSQHNPLFKFLGLNRWLRRLGAAMLLAGQVLFHVMRGRINRRNTLEQMMAAGPASLLITVVAALSVGSVFTIQVAREFLRFGAGAVVGGVLVLALVRELAPVIAAVLLAGRMGSAFAAEIGTMRVTEQIDALFVLRTDPVDYLVVPRVLACCLMMPILTLLFALAGTVAGLVVATTFFGMSQAIFITSVRNFLSVWDLISAVVKALVFGGLVAVVGSSWGLTTTGGAKGVGESTTAAVVTTLLLIFVVNFFLSGLLFQGQGSALGNL
ncbi:MAG: MlaE family lipid ABC transporter permease subunit [Synechococcales cyanobacterium RM1_1_8]|nr:MlaE family lipid ABC transporter permease subunit [Synechococcales cyanobacterium RM1_1_8]